jgi:hypothetical protein
MASILIFYHIPPPLPKIKYYKYLIIIYLIFYHSYHCNQKIFLPPRLLLPQAILKVITAVAPGLATITISCTKGGITKTDTVEVTVEGELPYWN